MRYLLAGCYVLCLAYCIMADSPAAMGFFLLAAVLCMGFDKVTRW